MWCHPTALVESDEIGEGTRIWAFAHVMRGARIGLNCNIGDHVFIEEGVTIGDNVTVKNGVCIWTGVEIGNGVFIGPNAVFTNDLYPRSPRLPAAKDRYETGDWLKRTHIREGTSIGANATIIPNVVLGAYSMIGAGSVVTQDVPDFAMVVGVPARQRGWVCFCGYPLETRDAQTLYCPECNSEVGAERFGNVIVEQSKGMK
ncbi:MAG: N-acetyltransferase [Armatimonadetes bacterium]|nr:N-acetyltransferase [Armatimonadota bacterium]